MNVDDLGYGDILVEIDTVTFATYLGMFDWANGNHVIKRPEDDQENTQLAESELMGQYSFVCRPKSLFKVMRRSQ